MYKRQIYQIAESNRKNRFGSENRIESKLFFARIGMLYYWPFTDSCRFTAAKTYKKFSALVSILVPEFQNIKLYDWRIGGMKLWVCYGLLWFSDCCIMLYLSRKLQKTVCEGLYFVVQASLAVHIYCKITGLYETVQLQRTSEVLLLGSFSHWCFCSRILTA